MARNYPLADVKILYGKAANRCAIPSCRMNVALDVPGDKSRQIGKIAHIVAHSPNGPRANSEYPQDKIDSYDNLILLCPTCHDTVDAQESKYSVDTLCKLKADHESWVKEQLDKRMSEVTFAELEIAAKAIATGQHFTNGDFHVITPEEKILKNGLTQEVRGLISTGLSRSSEVSEYLVKAAQLDSNFPERLTDGFKVKYLELKKTTSRDALFMEMFDFAKSGQHDFKQQAASLAILTHLFHLCEVFEK